MERSREEFLIILGAFREMIYNFENSAEPISRFEDMVIYRAASLIDNVLVGLKIDFESAIELLKAKDIHLTEREELERDTIIAAFDNLIEFATAQQYAMIQELPEILDLAEMDRYEAICEKYNYTYAEVENEQVHHAGLVAAFWLGASPESIITYNTQNDKRVRPWHQSYNGLSYKKSEFPPELIPPIEWACRCYLTEGGFGRVVASVLKPEIKVSPIFLEKLALGGRIFSQAHPYFKHKLPKEIADISTKLKQRLYAKDNA